MSAKVLVSTENMPYADWLEYRKLGIGGSDASVVCGISRYKSPVELWMDKTGQLPVQEAGEAAYWGTQLEVLVRAEFTKRTGIEVHRVSQLLQSEEYPFMLANLDGTCEVPDLGTCVFEAKTASAYKAGESKAKACKESVLLFLLRQDSMIPLLVRVPVTSKGRFLKYSTRLLSTLKPISSVVTKITLEKATSKQGKPYALFNFEAVSALSPEESAQARSYAQQFMEIVNVAGLVPELAEAG